MLRVAMLVLLLPLAAGAQQKLRWGAFGGVMFNNMQATGAEDAAATLNNGARAGVLAEKPAGRRLALRTQLVWNYFGNRPMPDNDTARVNMQYAELWTGLAYYNYTHTRSLAWFISGGLYAAYGRGHQWQGGRKVNVFNTPAYGPFDAGIGAEFGMVHRSGIFGSMGVQAALFTRYYKTDVKKYYNFCLNALTLGYFFNWPAAKEWRTERRKVRGR